MQVQGDVQLRMMKAELQNSKIYRTEKLTQTVHSECMEEVILQYDFGKLLCHGYPHFIIF